MSEEYFYEIVLTRSDDANDVYRYIVLKDDYDFAMKHASRICRENGYTHIQAFRVPAIGL